MILATPGEWSLTLRPQGHGHTLVSMSRRAYAIRFWREGQLVYCAVVEGRSVLEAYAVAYITAERVGASWWIAGELWPLVREGQAREGRGRVALVA